MHGAPPLPAAPCPPPATQEKLLDTTLATLEERGAPRVVLWTAERNESAQRLFARAGFRRTMLEMTRERKDNG